jgi:hypothetical protein
LEYVNIFQGDFIMGLGPLFNLATKFLGSGAAQQPATIERTEKSVPNAVVHGTSPQELTQLHAEEKQPTTIQAVTPEIIQNKAEPLTSSKEDTAAIKLEISQKTVDGWKPILSKAVKTLMEIIPFIAAEIKTILPKSEVGEIFSNIIKSNGGSEAVRQQLETSFINNLNQAMTKPQMNANPA